MIHCKMTAFAAVAAFGFAAMALASPPPPDLIRGTIGSVSGDQMMFKTLHGGTKSLTLDPKTKYVWLVPADLSSIKQGEFVGVTAFGPADKMVASEVHIFPESMRGTGEGHYGWTLPAMIANADAKQAGESSTDAANGPPVAGTMTNGSVASAASTDGPADAAGGPPVAGTMTNGAVSADAEKGSGRELTVTYDNGKTSRILVPGKGVVVRIIPGDRSMLTTGAKSFVIASRHGTGDALTVDLILVGKDGLLPPM